MQKSKTETLIQKYLSHQLNEQEFKELKQWIEEDASHKEIFVKLLSLRHVNNQLNLLQQFDKEASWEAIQKRCKQPHSIRYRVAIYSSAAAIAVIIGIASILYFNNRNLTPAITQSEQSSLPQNTQTPKATWVQANQSVIPLYENQREINGSYINNGEIIFPQESDYPHKTELDTELLQNKIIVPKGSEYAIVTHDAARPFIIKAHDHAIYVLGTTFNISAYPDEELSMTLIEGKLKVTAPSGEYYLLPGEHYSSAQSKVSKVDTEFYTSWTDGAMEFDAMPFPLLTARLSRCYNVDIQIASKELETMKFTGIIFRNKPLDFALDIIHRVSDVKFERKGETIFVKKQ